MSSEKKSGLGVSAIVSANENIKIYLISRTSFGAHQWNEEVAKNLFGKGVSVFVPQFHGPSNMAGNAVQHKVFQIDFQAMQTANMAVVVPPYGRDCAWEIGWFSNSKKPLIVFVRDALDWLRDWMVKGGMDYIVTDNEDSYNIICNDPFFSKSKTKVIFIQHISELNKIVLEVYMNGKQSDVAVAQQIGLRMLNQNTKTD